MRLQIESSAPLTTPTPVGGTDAYERVEIGVCDTSAPARHLRIFLHWRARGAGMGFGSYDESEQQEQTTETDDGEAVDAHEHDHDGDVSVESDVDTDDLVDRLGEMREE